MTAVHPRGVAGDAASSLSPEAASARARALQEALAGLVREREQLRLNGADRSDLEGNRRAIVECQWALSRALAGWLRSIQASRENSRSVDGSGGASPSA